MEVNSFYGENGIFIGLKSDFRSSFKALEKTNLDLKLVTHSWKKALQI
jgi:hypothetical protein